MKKHCISVIALVALCALVCFASAMLFACDTESNGGKICFKVNGEIYGYSNIASDGAFELPEEPTMEGNRFDGWYYLDENKNKVQITEEHKFTDASGVISLYAAFSPIGANAIRYELFGGANSDRNPQYCYDTDTGELAIPLSAPTRALVEKTEYSAKSDLIVKTEYYREYEFLGWYSDSAFTNEVTRVDYSLGEITLYARWNENYAEEILVSEERYFIDGDAAYIGSYPQTLVDDGAVLASLSQLITDMPTADESGDWRAYDFYVSGEQKNYSWYIDVCLDGVEYRGVYFTEYRPDNVDYGAPNVSRQERNGYYTNTVYWFRYEPIKWRVLSTEGGRALLFSDVILDVTEWQKSAVEVGDAWYVNGGNTPDGTYVNNYEYSSVRGFLNGEFFDTAMGQSQKSAILTITTDNSVATSFVNPNPYICSDTEDSVFLLSYRDVLKSEYGFDTAYSELDAARRKSGTDYANALGLRYNTSGDYADTAAYWLRTPFYASSNVPHLVLETGYSTAVYSATESCVGIAPAIYITLE